MSKVKRAKIEEDPKNNTLTLTRSRRTPKPNPKYLSDDIIVSSESRNSSRSNSLSGFDAKDYDSNEEDGIIEAKIMKSLPKKRPIVRLENITDIVKAMEESNKDDINIMNNEDDKKFKKKRIKNDVDDSDFVMTSSNDEDDDKSANRSGGGGRRNLRQATTTSPSITNKKIEVIGSNPPNSKTITTTKASSVIRTYSPKLRETKKIVNDSMDVDMMDFETSVPTFTIVNINDIIKRGPGRPKKRSAKKEDIDDTDYIEDENVDDDVDDDDDEEDELQSNNVRVTRRSAGDLIEKDKIQNVSSVGSGSNNNIDGNRNRRKTLHTTILREDFEIKKGPGRPSKKPLLRQPQIQPTQKQQQAQHNLIQIVKKTLTTTTKNNNISNLPGTGRNGKFNNITTPTTLISKPKIEVGQTIKSTPRILNSLLGRTNQNKVQPIISKIVHTKAKIDLTSDDEPNNRKFKKITDNDDGDDEDDDDGFFGIRGDDNRRKIMTPNNKQMLDEKQQQKQSELAKLIKLKENLKTYKNTGNRKQQQQQQQPQKFINNNNNNSKSNNNNFNKAKASDTLNASSTTPIKLNREKTKLAALMESKPRIVIQNRDGKRIKKITCFETWYVINIPNVTEMPTKSWVLINLITLGNDIKKIKLPTNEWSYRITLNKKKKIKNRIDVDPNDPNLNSLLNDENKEIYAGEIHDQNIHENEKSEYEPVSITFQRKSTNQEASKKTNIIEYDRTISFKNHAYSLIIDGKNCKLIGAPQYIRNLIDIEILLNIINDISLINSYVEQNVSSL